MTDLLLRVGVSNLCVSLLLAITAWVVQSRVERPRIAHFLWLLVLVKLVTPPVVILPVLGIPERPAAVVEAPVLPAESVAHAEALGAELAIPDMEGLSTTFLADVRTWLALAWLLGSLAALAWSLVQIVRFDRSLRMAAVPAPPHVQDVARGLARRLELKTMPLLCTTSANISPMVWWTGGRVRVVVPDCLVRDMDGEELRWILAHELAHVRRRDHLVRWLEWLACVGFWWNPAAWWARRNLRVNEEVCCDALVLSCLRPRPRTYASSLLNAVEFLASPAPRPPAVASEINSGGFLERRLQMIVSNKLSLSTPRWLSAVLLLFAVVLMPLGVAYAQDYDAVGKRLREAVQQGELTGEQARVMMDALRRAGQKEVPKGFDRERYAKAEAELKKAVEAGRISGEDARKRLEGLRREMAGQHERDAQTFTREEYARAEAEIKKLVEAGKVSKEDAHRRLEEMRKALGAQRERDARTFTREDYARIEKELKAAIEAGKISEEDAKARLRRVRERIGRPNAARDDVDWEAVHKRIEAAVKAGELTREEADAKHRKLREERAQERARDEKSRDRIEEYKAFETRIRAAVEAGEMTEKEAERKLIELRKKMFGDR